MAAREKAAGETERQRDMEQQPLATSLWCSSPPMPAALAIMAALVLLSAGGTSAAEADEFILIVRGAPSHGIVAGTVKLPPSVRPSGADAGEPLDAKATVAGRAIPAQLVPPAATGDDWLAVLKLPSPGDHEVRIRLSRRQRPCKSPAEVVAANRFARLQFDAKKAGPMPSSIRFARTGKVFESFAWNDRLHHAALGGFLLRRDAAARVELLADGPVCTVVRCRGRYTNDKGKQTATRAAATYDWLLLADLPLLLVRARITQAQPFAWNEMHFLELNYPDESFGDWAGGEPLKTGKLAAGKKSTQFGDWAMLRDGRNAIAMFRAGRPVLYDGRGEYGTYLHAHGPKAWQGWRDRERGFSAWLWLGDADDPVAAVRAAARDAPDNAQVLATLPSLREKLARLRAGAGAQKDPAERRRQVYRAAMAEKLEAAGEWDLAGRWADGAAPRGWTRLIAGDLAATFQKRADGIALRSLLDLAGGAELLAAEPAPLFAVTLRHVASGKTVRLEADRGWSATAVTASAGKLALRWARPKEKGLGEVIVAAEVEADAKRSRLSWALSVTNPHKDWGVWRVSFPQVAAGAMSPDVHALVQQGSGVVRRDVWQKAFRVGGTYPDGWTAMQFLAAYDAGGKTGLYVAVHDPAAATKDIRSESDGPRRRLTMTFDHPAPDMGASGAGFTLGGKAVWQILRGDWFDAAMIYRDWVRREATWWPKLGPDGRGDTTRWMRELCVWGLLGGSGKGTVMGGQAFAKAMGLPCGFHWYSWHQIPFDNDYPHYFPPKKGFKASVAELQTKSAQPVYIMPYINGRLWDTRDKGVEDFEFGKLARAAATKNHKGEPYTESYGSKESDGTNVKLAAMCPSTKLWQDRVRGIVVRLMTEYGCKGVYIDQIAAAKPQLCFDKSHGHPLGGGGWWVASYGKLLERLRREMPAGSMITTECNAEPYVKWFDGYLTWHWQFDGQVPAFSAVYGGALQMFGRAYRGGPTKDLALRMKAGQQLVFGEQIGWIDAGIANDKAGCAFLRQVVHLRHRLRRYFHAGQMARPPKLAGKLPTVTADWQWSGVWPVTTDAVLTGAWELPAEGKLALIFVNVSDKPVTAKVAFDAAAHGLKADKLRLAHITPDAAVAKWEVAPPKFTRKVTFEPRKAWAWQFAPAKP